MTKLLHPSSSVHLVHVVAYYPPHLGGMENVAQQLAEHLAVRGADIEVITSGRPPRSTENGVKVTRLWNFEFAHTPFAPALLLHLLRIPRRSIVHLHLAQAYWPDMVWLVSKIRGIPYIVHFHLDVGPSGPLGSIFMFYKRLFWGSLLRSAQRVVVFSEDQKTLVQTKYGVLESNIAIIPNGVGEEFFSKEACTRPHDPVRLLYVGRLDAQKRVDRIIDAMKLLTLPAHLTIVGDGELRGELEERVRSFGLENVSFVGRKGGEALIAEYCSTDILLSSSDREGMSLVMLEAMASGLPIIATDVIGTRELLDGVGILVQEPYAQNLAEAIDELVGAPARAAALSEASAACARAHSWALLTESFESLYHSVAV